MARALGSRRASAIEIAVHISHSHATTCVRGGKASAGADLVRGAPLRRSCASCAAVARYSSMVIGWKPSVALLLNLLGTRCNRPRPSSASSPSETAWTVSIDLLGVIRLGGAGSLCCLGMSTGSATETHRWLHKISARCASSAPSTQATHYILSDKLDSTVGSVGMERSLDKRMGTVMRSSFVSVPMAGLK